MQPGANFVVEIRPTPLPTERTITVPAGDHLFFPIANFEFDPIGFFRNPTEPELCRYPCVSEVVVSM